MEKALVKNIWISAAAITLLSLGAVAQEELCLDCHVPQEDWEGMSAEEIYAVAVDVKVKRHKDNRALSEEEVRALIDKLLSEEAAK